MLTFEEIGLRPEVLKAIDELGFVHPTPIQEKIIPALLNSTQDLIGLAQTGTGKTAAFGLPVIEKVILIQEIFRLWFCAQPVNCVCRLPVI